MISKVIGIIPARFASTRFPAKLLAPILGKSLIQRTYENAKKMGVFSELLIATDDTRIKDHVLQFGASVIMTSTNCLSGTDRITEVLQTYPHYQEADVIVNIQGDEPCVSSEAIISIVQLLLDDKSASMATAIAPLSDLAEIRSASIVKCVKDQNNNALYFSRSVIPSELGHAFDGQKPYYRHIGLYAYRPRLLLELQTKPATPLQLAENLEQLKVLEYGYKIKVALTNEVSLGVDYPEDLVKIERWLCTQNTFLLQEESAPPSAKD